MHKLNTDFPIEIIFVWVVCILILLYILIRWWRDYTKDDDYIIENDDRLLSDLSMLGINDE